MILGITGGTGCGKTTLLQVLGRQGFLILDCDAIYHGLLGSDRDLLSRIGQRFPGTVTDGILDRKKLGGLVFSDEKALADLNAITHSAVRAETERRLAGHRGNAAIDAIALFESGLSGLCQITVAVTAPVEDRVRRLMARDQISEDYARSRIAAQHPAQWFEERCSYCLCNDGTPLEFEHKCLAFSDRLGIMKENRKGDDTND